MTKNFEGYAGSLAYKNESNKLSKLGESLDVKALACGRLSGMERGGQRGVPWVRGQSSAPQLEEQ